MKLIERFSRWLIQLDKDDDLYSLGLHPNQIKYRPARTFTWKEGDETVTFRGTLDQYIEYTKFLELN